MPVQKSLEINECTTYMYKKDLAIKPNGLIRDFSLQDYINMKIEKLNIPNLNELR